MKISDWDLKFNPIQKELWAAKGWDIESDSLTDAGINNRPKLEHLVGEGKLSKVDYGQNLCYSQNHMYAHLCNKGERQYQDPESHVDQNKPYSLAIRVLINAGQPT